MFFAENSDKITASTYLDLVNKLVDKKDETFKTLIDEIINETIKATQTEGNSLLEVDSSIYYIVSKLYHSNASFFKEHKDDTDRTDVYKSMQEFLGTLSQSEIHLH